MEDLSEIIADNAAELDKLTRFVETLNDAQLTTPMPAGWTVAAVLGHLAFWDVRGVTLLEKWFAEGIGPSPIDVDVVNEATRYLCLAIPPQAAVALCLESAQRIDEIIAGLTPEQVAEITQKGTTVHLRRGDHRRTHMKDMQAALEVA